MSKWELILCKPSGEEKIKNPDWKQIKSYLDQVDGDRVVIMISLMLYI